MTRSYASTTDHQLRCSNEHGERVRDLRVLVGPGIVDVAFDVPAVVLSERSAATVSWATNELVSCALDGAPVDLSGALELTFDAPADVLTTLVCSDALGGEHVDAAFLQVY